MAHFYGTLQGSRGVATRCGTKTSGLFVQAASWEGAVSVSLVPDAETGETIATVSLIPWHRQGTRRDIFIGPVSGAPARKAVA